MADENQLQEKTEDATPKRRDDARQEGQVARSMELNSAAVLGSALTGLALSGGWILHHLQTYMAERFTIPPQLTISPDNILEIFQDSGQLLLIILAPTMLSVMVAGILSNMGQVGPLLSTKSLEPKWDRLNPMKGIGNLLSLRSLVELVKSLLKVSLVGLVVYLVIRKQLPVFLQFGFMETEQAAWILVVALFKMALWVLAFLLTLAAADFVYQRWDLSNKLKMTLQEVKEERKSTEGDPQLKGKIRGMQMETAYNRMISDLPAADVVVTNPTHLAVALRYDPNTMSAPRVIAKGRRKVAERIKAIARDNGIPVIENKPLARGLFKACDIGMDVPLEFYRAVAELLAWVFRSRERKSA